MDCAAVREALAVYRDLNAGQRLEVDAHVARCGACQGEFVGVRQITALLDKLPTPQVRVDVARIYQRAQVWQECRLRRWRRLAAGLVGVAALLLVAVGLNLEIRVDSGQLIVRWGQRQEANVRPSAPFGAERGPTEAGLPPEVTTDLKLMRDLIHALAADMDSRDRQQQETLAALQTKLEQIDRQAQERWAATVNFVAATRTENPTMEGEKP